MLKSCRSTSELGSRWHERDGIVHLFCPKSNPPVQKALYFEKKGDLKKNGTAKPTASPALRNWLSCFFFNSVWLASTGMATPEMHHQARLAQTGSLEPG
jgi:hypothetical protein